MVYFDIVPIQHGYKDIKPHTFNAAGATLLIVTHAHTQLPIVLFEKSFRKIFSRVWYGEAMF